jgi:hypothetical protein
MQSRRVAIAHRASAAASVSVLTVLAVLLVPASGLAAASRIPDGPYAESATVTVSPEGYSNGGVDLTVIDGGRKLEGAESGVSCYTGSNPPAGVPTYDEVSIHLPRNLTIGAGGLFSFSGPVTLSPEEAQSESPIQTTYTLKGRFAKGKHGSYKALGTDSSPICQPSTLKHFSAALIH